MTHDARERLLALKLRGRRAAESPIGVAPRREGEEVALSFAQEALWFVELLLGHSSAYNSFHCVQLAGRLDEAALRRALSMLVARHEALRTGIGLKDGAPVARVVEACEVALARLEAHGATPDERERAALRAARRLIDEPFALERPPLVRAAVVAIEPDHQLLVLVVHHLVTDGTSMAVVAHELGRLYDACREARAPELDPVALQYPDYAAWQRRRLQGPRLEELLSYWRNALDGIEPLRLRTDRPRPMQPSYDGRTLRFALPQGGGDAVRALARRERATPFMVLLAAFQALLSHYSGADDVVVGSPVAGRTRPETERAVGYFVNSVVLRTDLSGDPTFSDLLARVRLTALGAFEHQDLPFDHLVSALNPHRDVGRNPLYQVSFALNNQAPVELTLGGLEVLPVELASSTSKFDLSLALVEADGDFQGRIEYSTALFDPGTIEGLARHYVNILCAALEAPDTCLSRLPLLDAAERRRILDSGASLATAHADGETLHGRIARRAALDPVACAVLDGAQRTDYGTLLAQAHQVARGLAAAGVRQGDAVALCAGRSAGLVAAILGILEAGAVYVPIDPSTPAARARFMVSDSGARVVLTEPALRAQFSTAGCTVACLGEDWPAASGHVTHDAAPAVAPGDLAYLIYTSGSTGQPKGVEVTHASACNHAAWFASAVGASADDRFLFKSSIAFDASLVEVFVPLGIGASLVVAQDSVGLDPTRDIETIVRDRVSVLQAVPSSLRVLLAQPDLERMYALRYLVCGGEALDWALVRQARSRLPGVRLGNFYGPTETCIDACWYPIEGPDDGEGPVPIGRPIANLRCHVLDAHLEPVPDGVVGELHVGGAGLARGYRNRPELTRAAFVADPFHPGQRLYATGDLVRRRADGQLIYVGRANTQIKLRGLRIELGEIEAALAAQPEVGQSAVVPLERRAGDTRLIAYVVPRDPARPLDEASLRARLAAFLPDYMLPAAWVTLPALPLTRNGKIDRAALPAPEASTHQVERPIDPPQGSTEVALAELWRELLGVAQVGRDDDFFALGGNSLLVVALVDAMRRRSMVIEVRTVFLSSTLKALAAASAPAAIGAEDGPVRLSGIPAGCLRIEPSMLPLVSLQQTELDVITRSVPGGAANVQEIYPLAPLQVGILWRHLLDRGCDDGYLHRWVFAFDDPGRRERFLHALQQVIDRHDALRTSLRWEGLDEPVQVVQRQAALPRRVVAVAAGADALDTLCAASDPTHVVLDLAVAPLIVAFSADDPAHARWLLALDHHHAVLDHVSEEIVVDEIRALLDAEPAPLPRAPQFREWLARARREGFTPHAAYFRALLGDVEQPTLPFGQADVDRPVEALRRHRTRLPALLTRSIRNAAAAAQTSVAVLMHAVWACVVGACSGRDDIVFGTVLSGRSQRLPGIDRTVGLFINTLPVRLGLSGVTVRGLIDATRRQLGELTSHEAATLVDAQRCSAVPPGGPLFGALLNFRQSRADLVAVPGEDRATSATFAGVQWLRSDGTMHYPFGLAVDDLGDDLVLTAHADGDTDPARLVAFVSHVASALARAVHDRPDTPVTTLGVLDAGELATLEAFASGPVQMAEPRTVHGLAARHAARAPLAIALEDARGAVSYGALEASSNRIARALRARGVGRGSRVGLCLQRDAAMVAAQIGILKSGAAYLPLDPAYPQERLRYMADDARLAALLSDSSLAAALDWPRESALLLDHDAAWIEAQSAEPLPDDELSARPGDAAYVIYTSGSTGRPKGVVVPHGAVANFLESMAREPGLARGDRLLAVTTLSFDIAVLELLLPLAVGATVVLASREQAGDAWALRALLERSAATVMQATPATWRMLIDAGWRGSARFKALIGGEALSPVLARELLGRCGALWNMYGPTETTVWSTCWKVEQPQGGISIGRPIANTTVRVLDQHGRQCPIGVAGEICIGGEGVALGYLNQPQLTAERFVASPFTGQDCGRLYRTGDLGRWRVDGSLEHLGRIDHQLKLRGYRIEPGEIEAVLGQHQAVRQAVVVAREAGPGDTRLVAYMRYREGHATPVAELFRHLRAVLPEYMLPSRVVALETIPLTPSGKVDRTALPDPFDGAEATDTRVQAPGTPSESTLNEIWAALLGCEDIDRDDNFFDLGGHSLLVMQAIAQIEKRTGVHFSPRQLMFDSLAQLAARLDEALLAL